MGNGMSYKSGRDMPPGMQEKMALQIAAGMAKDDDLWRTSEKFITVCAKCSREGLKRNMNGIYIKARGCSQVKVLCHFCDRCLPALLDELEVSMPE